MSSYHLFDIETLHKPCLPLNFKYLSTLDWQQEKTFPTICFDLIVLQTIKLKLN